MQQIRINARDALFADTDAERADAANAVRKLDANVTQHLASFERTIISETARRDFAELVAARNTYAAILERMLALDAQGRQDDAEQILKTEGKQAAQRYQQAIERLMDSKVEQAAKVSRENRNAADEARLAMLLLMGGGVACSLALGTLLTRSVMAQLGEDPGYLHDISSSIAAGNLEAPFRATRPKTGVHAALHDMVQALKAKIADADQKTQHASAEAERARLAGEEAERAKAQAERARAEGMLHAAGQLEDVVVVISSAAEQLSAQTHQSSRGAEVQSTRVGETATAMEEMNATVIEVARSAAQAASAADAARTKAGDGARIVGQVIDGIGTVERVSTGLRDDMQQLGRQAEGIGQVLNVISDIADQTNLLALNAAIEAARAGDAGRGFAVVADEVRKLAEKTMNATREVEEAVRGIQSGARRNMDTVDRAVQTVGEATRLAGMSGEALGQIVSLVDAASDQVRSIATASEQQSATSEEINRSIDDINRISGDTAHAMRQASGAVKGLSGQVETLRGLIGHMKAAG